MTQPRKIHFLYAMVATVAVFVFAHWDGLTNPYIIRDNVRQQVFWMQQWQDPELYQNDLLTEYSQNYVPWGIKAIYRVGARVMNPVQFTKVVTAVLFLLTAGFLFGLGTAFRDELVPVFVVCVFLFFGAFMRKISGGLSQSFAFPCLAAYLFFLSRKMLVGSGAVIFLLSFVNPYMFLLCLGTQIDVRRDASVRKGRCGSTWIDRIVSGTGEVLVQVVGFWCMCPPHCRGLCSNGIPICDDRLKRVR